MNGYDSARQRTFGGARSDAGQRPPVARELRPRRRRARLARLPLAPCDERCLTESRPQLRPAHHRDRPPPPPYRRLDHFALNALFGRWLAPLDEIFWTK